MNLNLSFNDTLVCASKMAQNYAIAKRHSFISQPKLSELLETVPEKPRDWQLELLVEIITSILEAKSLCDSSRFYLIQGAYGIGKTTFGALLTLSHFYQFGFLEPELGYKGNIVSGSLIQLSTVTCAVLREILTRSHFKYYFTMTGNQIYLNSNPNKFIRFCVCNSANIDSFAGIHKANGFVYNYFDEGTAVHDKAYNIAETFMDKGNCTWIVTGNPTGTDGEFYRCSTSNKWITKKITRYDFFGEDDCWGHDMKIEHGEDSDVYRMKVLAEFPMNSASNVISIHSFNEAKKRGKIYAYSGLSEYKCSEAVIMVDPSTNSGNCDHGVCIRDNIAIREIYPTNGGIMELAQHVADITDRYDIVQINLDVICCGWGLDTCIRICLNKKSNLKVRTIPIVAVDNRTRPTHNKFCFNKRAENMMEGKKWMESIGGICPTPYMDRFFHELMQAKYVENALNIQIEKKEGVVDLADSYFGTFENPSLLVNLAAQKPTHIIQKVMHAEYAHNNTYGIRNN